MSPLYLSFIVSNTIQFQPLSTISRCVWIPRGLRPPPPPPPRHFTIILVLHLSYGENESLFQDQYFIRKLSVLVVFDKPATTDLILVSFAAVVFVRHATLPSPPTAA